MRFLLIFFLLAQVANAEVASVCDRTYAIRLSLEDDFGKPCNEITEDDLTGVTHLDLKMLGITQLKVIDFSGMTQLTNLYLNSNYISTLPVGVFDGLSKLHNLHLDDNNITELEYGLFKDNVELDILNIDNNLISYIPDGLFENQAQMSSLSLRRNYILEVRPEMFRGLRELERIELEYNSISVLRADWLAELPYLRHALMDHNRIQRLDDGALRGATDNLIKLSMCYSPIQYVSEADAMAFKDATTEDVTLYISNISTPSVITTLETIIQNRLLVCR